MTEYLSQIPDQIWTILSALAGGIISALAGYLAQKTIERRSKNELLMRRLEEIYESCQFVYDGHAARIDWLTSRDKVKSDEWLQIPKPPGVEMSRIKMRTRSYVPHLEASLKQMDDAHQWFKTFSAQLNEKIEENGFILRGEDYSLKVLNPWLEELGHGSNTVKLGVADRLKTYFG